MSLLKEMEWWSEVTKGGRNIYNLYHVTLDGDLIGHKEKILLAHTSSAKFLPELPGAGVLGPTLIPCSVSDLSRQVT